VEGKGSTALTLPTKVYSDLKLINLIVGLGDETGRALFWMLTLNAGIEMSASENVASTFG